MLPVSGRALGARAEYCEVPDVSAEAIALPDRPSHRLHLLRRHFGDPLALPAHQMDVCGTCRRVVRRSSVGDMRMPHQAEFF